MIFTSENILLLGAVLVFVSILVSKTGFKFGIPTLLLFLLVVKGQTLVRGLLKPTTVPIRPLEAKCKASTLVQSQKV